MGKRLLVMKTRGCCVVYGSASISFLHRHLRGQAAVAAGVDARLTRLLMLETAQCLEFGGSLEATIRGKCWGPSRYLVDCSLTVS